MPASVVVTIAVVVILAGLIVLGAEALWFRRRMVLRRRFGAEFDRVLADTKSRRKTAAELTERERRVASLNIRPLTAAESARYVSRWLPVQEGFVDQPDSAVDTARQLVTEVIGHRGYATQDYDQLLADLSVDHASSVGHYRSARGLSDSANGVVSTENLRQALIHYRSMFDDLVGKPAADVTDPEARVSNRADGQAEPSAADEPSNLRNG
jgi:hypothetical protein